jgi:hypothetical protein
MTGTHAAWPTAGRARKNPGTTSGATATFWTLLIAIICVLSAGCKPKARPYSEQYQASKLITLKLYLYGVKQKGHAFPEKLEDLRAEINWDESADNLLRFVSAQGVPKEWYYSRNDKYLGGYLLASPLIVDGPIEFRYVIGYGAPLRRVKEVEFQQMVAK